MKKLKVLIVTYYWPPSSGGGVQRWLKLATHMPEFGIEPIIFTPENPAFDLQDQSLSDEVPENMEVWRFPIWEPLQLFSKKRKPLQGQVLEQEKKSLFSKVLIWVRAFFFIPDPRVFWVRPSVRFLEPMIDSNKIDIVITTGPPHSMHLIGRQLKRKTGVKWVADFRDPWSEWDILDKLGVNGWARKRHREIEGKVLKEVDLLITVSESWCKDFGRLGATKSFVLTNGFEPSAAVEGTRTSSAKFIVAHVGMLNEMRNPTMLWESLSELCSESIDFARSMEIYLAGILSEKVINSIKSFPELSNKLVVDGYLTHASARRAMQNSQLLLLIMNDSANAKGHIPGKVFEYLEARRPILAVGDPDGDTAAILTKANAGTCISFQDKPKMKACLQKVYEDFNLQKPFEPKGIDQFSRRSLAMKLSSELFKL